MTNEEEIHEIAVALDAILTALREADRASTGDMGVGRTFGQLVGQAMATSEKAQAAQDLIADPIGGALRHAIEALGERLNEIGGIPAMHAAMDAVSTMKPDDDGWRENVLDHRWSGIGDWLA